VQSRNHVAPQANSVDLERGELLKASATLSHSPFLFFSLACACAVHIRGWFQSKTASNECALGNKEAGSRIRRRQLI
jgi:hypothetical protein